MGKWYKDKHSHGCALCKPHKHGWALKYKEKEVLFRKESDKEMSDAMKESARQWRKFKRRLAA